MLKHIFKKPNIEPEVPVSIEYHKCIDCGTKVDLRKFEDDLKECVCGKSLPLSARKRIDSIADKSSFVELHKNLCTVDILEFKDYKTKLETAKKASGELEAVIVGHCSINGLLCCIFVMDTHFFMGSMGVVVGEKITRIFEYATINNLPVIGFCASGGARMQEGIFSLMQMAKTSGAIKRHSDKGLLYISVLTNPTTGGVTASFAMESDIIIAEPKSLIAFAGPRVIEQTIKQKLPFGFQISDFVLNKGFIDLIVKRKELKPELAKLLRMHCKSEK